MELLPLLALRVVRVTPFRGLDEGASKRREAAPSAAQRVEVDKPFPSPATGVVGDPSRLPLLPLGLATFPAEGTPILPGVVHAPREELPRRTTGLESRAVALMTERNASDELRVVLGVPTVP